MPHHDLPKNKRRTIIAAASVMVGFVLVFSGLFAGYIYSLADQLEADNRTRLHEVSNFIASHMTTVVSQTQEALHVVANAVSALDSREKRLTYLQTVADRYSFAYMGYAGSDGMLYTTVFDAPEDIRNEAYFQTAQSGSTTASNLVRRIFPTHATSGIILAVPLRLSNDNGVLVAMLCVRTLSTALQLETFGGEGVSYVIDRNGTVVMRTRSLDISNLFNLWRSYRFSTRQSYQQVQEQISRGEDGLASFTNHAGVGQYAHYSPLPFNGWMVVNVVAQHTVFGQTLTLSRDLAIVAGGTVLLFMGLLLWNMRAYRLSLESRSAADAKSAFLANMSHEIRTPMNAIVGISEIMLRDELSSRHHEQLLSIRNSGKGLLTIINDILDISKIESGGFTIVEESYELESLLYDLTIISVIRLGEKPVEFLVEVAPGVPRLLVGDMGRVKQVLLNIIGNAIKFTPKGSIRVRLQARREAGKWHLGVEVVDTGMGIRPEDVQKLFVRFAQVDTRRNRNVEGTGLGLTISQKLCELMGGGISVTSEYGQGSTFTIRLTQGIDPEDDAPLVGRVSPDVSLLVCNPMPEWRNFEVACLQQIGARFELCDNLAAVEQSLRRGTFSHVLATRAVLRSLPPDLMPEVCRIELLAQREHTLIESSGASVYMPLLATQLSYALNGGESASRLRRHTGMELDAIEPMPHVAVLIVDDNELNVQVAEGLLAPYGMRLRHAYSGQEAIQLVQTQNFDLVLMDHMMPEMDGVETLAVIRSLPDERLQRLPVVALTANTTNEARQMFMERGFNDFLAKPIETTRLNAVLIEWLKDLNAQRAATQPVRGDEATASEETGAMKEDGTKTLAPSVVEGSIVADSIVSDNSAEDNTAMPRGFVEVDFNVGLKRLPMPGLYVKILGKYAESTAEKLNELAEWMDTDPHRVVIEVHGLKSASASIGAQRLADAAQELETLGKSGDFEAVRAGLPDFVAHGQAVIEEVKAYLQRVP